MSNAELFDHLMETNPQFRERYKGLAESVAKEEGTFFNKAYAWIASKSMDIKDKQDKMLDSGINGLKKIGFFIGIALCFYLMLKYKKFK